MGCEKDVGRAKKKITILGEKAEAKRRFVRLRRVEKFEHFSHFVKRLPISTRGRLRHRETNMEDGLSTAVGVGSQFLDRCGHWQRVRETWKWVAQENR